MCDSDDWLVKYEMILSKNNVISLFFQLKFK